jgi:hypothetical protein
MKLRRLRPEGIRKMEFFIESQKTDDPVEYPSDILTDSATSELVSNSTEVHKKDFKNKLECAEYLHKCFNEAGLEDVVLDQGLWAWLALFYFDNLCPVKNGQYKPGELAKWIPQVDNYQRYYRHLLAGLYRIYRNHVDNPENAAAFLCGPLHQRGDIIEQIASRQELITNKALVSAATKLYYDKKSDKRKRGSGGKGAGSPRRLAQVIDQFSLTWDLYSITADEILELLPSEFDRFKN